MRNPKPIGWQKCVDLNMIDFCDWENAVEQENSLPGFVHANFKFIRKFWFNSTALSMLVTSFKCCTNIIMLVTDFDIIVVHL